MELDLVTGGLSDEETYEINDDYDSSTFDGERCGICMDIIIDRGVLDCCQHWFCFVCIDNWATITNLCPLCQKEFQLITCVPVYDTIGSSKVDEDAFRDDDWCIEGKHNTLSFPSYYIDEDAVVCLDGDDCKIRSASATIEEDSILDTSIACDSCDIWYHAFCVGFDPDGTSEATWLCPRCVVNKLPQKPYVLSAQQPNNQSDLINADSECVIEAAFSGKVSVSVADAGETAVVISMVEGGQRTEEPSENFFSTLEAENSLRTEKFILTSDANIPEAETPSKDGISMQTVLQPPALELCLSHDASFSPPPNLLVGSELKKWCLDGRMNESSGPYGTKVPPTKFFDESDSKNKPSDCKSNIGLHLGLSVGYFPSVGYTNNTGTEDQVTRDEKESNPLEESSLRDESTVLHAIGNTGVLIGAKRKHRDYSDVFSSADNGGTKAIDTEATVKKVRAVGKIQTTPSKGLVDPSFSDDLTICMSPIASNGDESKHGPVKEDITSDILSIIRETDHRPIKVLSGKKHADKFSKEKENAAGLRVKKIMRRAGEDKESSMAVKELRKEIREVVRNRSSEDIGDHLFDPKLLAAFRDAVAGPKTEPVNKLSPLSIKAKKSMLQKGKVRENLTKKIYGNSNGKRRHAWVRDCEVEFWKHRCSRYTKPEKIQTLMSVLDLLKKNSKSSDMEQGSKCQPTNSILSRLYLADTSIFPRKDNIKPLSALDNSNEKTTETNKVLSTVGISAIDDKGGKNNLPGLKGDTACKSHPHKQSEGPSSPHSGSVVKLQKETVAKSGDIKSDKRKWALEVLARKNSVASRNSKQEKAEDNAALKGNYPLLAQLPIDMRPALAPSTHNKIPLSVRQTQLYRLTEHFLKKANLRVMSRTAETELAVADAINIEKEVANRSNSKLVYVNLCSQELLHRTDSKSGQSTEPDPSLPSAIPVNGSEQAINSTDPVVVEALKAAGLLSDSPPNSPDHSLEVPKEDNDSTIKINEEELDNVIEMDSHPELDIYGDFEYDLEDEDYIGATAINNSKLQPEDAPKMKVIFSTLELERSSSSLDVKESETVEAENHSSGLHTCSPDAGIKDPTLEGETDKLCVLPDTLPNEGGDELSVAECEELYGPEKEPLIQRFPEEASRKLPELVCTEGKDDNNVLESDQTHESHQAAKAPESTTGHNSEKEKVPNLSQTGKNVQKKEKKTDTDADKQYNSKDSISKKVEVYIKEHIRPLCKSGVITAEQYRWAVSKTTEKVMKHHCKAKNANFLIKEGEKVKKLAEQYIEAAQHKEKK